MITSKKTDIAELELDKYCGLDNTFDNFSFVKCPQFHSDHSLTVCYWTSIYKWLALHLHDDVRGYLMRAFHIANKDDSSSANIREAAKSTWFHSDQSKIHSIPINVNEDSFMAECFKNNVFPIYSNLMDWITVNRKNIVFKTLSSNLMDWIRPTMTF